jgi:hypothetical protein
VLYVGIWEVHFTVCVLNAPHGSPVQQMGAEWFCMGAT